MRPPKSSGSLHARGPRTFCDETVCDRQNNYKHNTIFSTIILERIKMMEVDEKPQRLPVVVEKPTPYTFDLGYLMAVDPNPLQLESANIEDDLSATARDGAQALINQLLGTCPITSTPAGVLLTLPAPSTHLPREKVCITLLLLWQRESPSTSTILTIPLATSTTKG